MKLIRKVIKKKPKEEKEIFFNVSSFLKFSQHILVSKMNNILKLS